MQQGKSEVDGFDKGDKFKGRVCRGVVALSGAAEEEFR